MPITLIYDDKPSVLPKAKAAGEDLWLSLSDLTVSTQWEMKPEGLCRETVCIPVPDDRRPRLLRGEGAEIRLNLAEFARLIEQVNCA